MGKKNKILDPKEYYKLREGAGRFPEYTPDGLFEKFNEYSEWVQSNNLKEEQLFHYQGTVVKGQATKMRAFSIGGFCSFADIVVNTFKNYEDKEEFLIVTSRIRQAIENQQFEGAAGGFLNPSIMARKLGLIDKQDMTSNGKSITPPKEISVTINRTSESESTSDTGI